MSQEELRRVEVLARVRSEQLRLVDASQLMRVSYRQAKRLWKRYREEGPAGLKHRSAGRTSNCAHGPEFRQRVLRLVREKYGGDVGERFGPTLAAEHLPNTRKEKQAKRKRQKDARSQTPEGDILIEVRRGTF
jgi:Helix-turn-helix domain